MSYDYNSWEPLKVNKNDLTEHETFLLRDSETFCIYPWIHIHAYPTGESYPCCHAEHVHPIGNCNQNDIAGIINNDKMKSLRLDMLDDVKRKECARCYEQEEHGFFSGRKSANKHHGHHIKKVSETNNDGSIDDFKMSYWDIRFSNLCNLKCRSCGHIFSSQWHKDQAKIVQQDYWNNVRDDSWPIEAPSTTEDFNGLNESIKNELRVDFNNEIFSYLDYEKRVPVLNTAGRFDKDMLNQVLEHINYVEQIYFAGGEPLVMEEHYIILNKIIESGRSKDVRLQYNTNFTKLDYKGQHVFDLWKHFDQVSIGASLDAMGKHAEYIRSGTKWQIVEENIKKLKSECPHVDFYISPTVSIMNALHVTQFHKDWVDKGFLNPQDLSVNILQDPVHYRIDIADDEYKQRIHYSFKSHLEWLADKDPLQRATTGFKSAINFLQNDNSQHLKTFWEKTEQMDGIRNESIYDSIPEIKYLRRP